MKYTKFWIGLCFSAIMLLTACGGKNDAAQQKAPPPVAVNTILVKEGSAMYYDQYPATVTALNQVEIRPQVAGYITGIFFTEGSHVNKGDKLYSIDPQQYLGSYEQAKANLSVAEANRAKAQQDADRYEELSKQDAIARQTLDHALADLEAAKKQVDAAKANVSSVETNLRYSIITAPFSGTIGISEVKMGASVSPGQTLLNTISSDDPIAVDVAIDETQIPRFVRLQNNKMARTDSVFYVVLADQSRYPFPGKVYLIDRAVDPQTATIKTRLEFPNPKKELKVGMTCNVFVKNNTAQKSILIPYKAVTEQMGEFFIFIVGDSNKVSQHKIQLGARIRDQVVVRNGLEANQQIVIDGMQKLRDGSVVQPAPAKQDSTKTAMTAEKKDSTKAK